MATEIYDASFDAFLKFFVIIFGVQWCGFICSIPGKRVTLLFESAGASTCAIVAYFSYDWGGKWNSPRNTIQTILIFIWSLRLGYFMINRSLNYNDFRFEALRGNSLLMFGGWTIQGIWVLVTMIPTFLLNLQTTDSSVLHPTFRDYLGWSLFIIGFVIETVADDEKSAFRNDPKTTNAFITSGLWSASRHPNYCGEILLWFGLWLSASSELRGYSQLALLCPIFDYILLMFISGVKLLEERGISRWGHQTSYSDYLQSTPVLFPFPLSKFDHLVTMGCFAFKQHER